MAKQASTRHRTKPRSSPRRKADAKAAPRLVPLEVYLRQQPWKRRGLVLLVVLLLASLSWADHAGWFFYPGSDWQRYHEKAFRVVRIVDGDTLVIDVADKDQALTRVRLWGVDTPETARYRGEQLLEEAEPFADTAREFALEWTEGQVVVLELESHRMRGRYGRILAFVRLPDGSYLNERLLAAGLARNDPRFLHRDAQRYEMLEDQARLDAAGMWAD